MIHSAQTLADTQAAPLCSPSRCTEHSRRLCFPHPSSAIWTLRGSRVNHSSFSRKNPFGFTAAEESVFIELQVVPLKATHRRLLSRATASSLCGNRQRLLKSSRRISHSQTLIALPYRQTVVNLCFISCSNRAPDMQSSRLLIWAPKTLGSALRKQPNQNPGKKMTE